MKKSFRSFFYILLVFIAIYAIVSAMNSNEKKYAISEKAYVEALNNTEIAKVTINQNKEVPTGYIIITFTSSTEKKLYSPL